MITDNGKTYEEVLADSAYYLYKNGFTLDQVMCFEEVFNELRKEKGCLLREDKDQKGSFILIMGQTRWIKVYLIPQLRDTKND